MKPAVLAGTALAILLSASAAHAEQWIYFAIPGGALAYDLESRRVDLGTGAIAADVLTYYFVPQAVGAKSYNIRSERMVIDCRANQFHLVAMGLFNDAEALQVSQKPTDWTPIRPGTPPAVFQIALCLDKRPPTSSVAKDQVSLRTALHALPPTARVATAPAPVAPAKPAGPTPPPAPKPPGPPAAIKP